MRFCCDSVYFKTLKQLSETFGITTHGAELNGWLSYSKRTQGYFLQCIMCVSFIFEGSALNLLHVVLFTTTSSLYSDERVWTLSQKGSFIGLLPCLCSSPPPSTLWSTVLPHTNSPYGEIGVSRTANICFPRWFCYCNSLAQKQGQGFRAASFLLQPKCLHLLISSYIHT